MFLSMTQIVKKKRHVTHSRKVVLTPAIGISAKCVYRVIIVKKVKIVHLKSGSVLSVLVCAGVLGVCAKII
jgi:hypothetical protein